MITKKFFLFICHALGLVLAINLTYVFIRAYVNNFQIKVYINNYNEAHVELIFFILSLFVLSVGVYLSWRNVKKCH